MGSVVGSLVNVAAQREHINYTYRIHASADVQGVGIGPHQNVSIQLEPSISGQSAFGGFVSEQGQTGAAQASPNIPNNQPPTSPS